MYDSKAQGALYQSQDRLTTVNIKAVGFVDDVRSSIDAFENNQITLEQLVAMARRDSQTWHDILFTSNQALDLPKCGYHAIIFEFKPNEESYMINFNRRKESAG